MDIKTELHNLKRMVLNESHISETTKEKIANRIFEIEKSVAIKTRNKTNETIVRLFAKAMFYGDWKWETPNERVITMLMQEIGMLGFKDEDEMIAKTKVKEKLYRKAIKLIPSVPCESNQSKTDKECKDISN